MTYDNLNFLPHSSWATMDRLLMPRALSDIDRLIYLDTDVLVPKDLTPLLQTELNDLPIAARPSIFDKWLRGYRLSLDVAERYGRDDARRLRTFLFDRNAIYFQGFNAGVLVMSLAQLRDSDFLEMMHNWGLHDQLILNVFCNSSIVPLAPEWNHYAIQKCVADSAIVHFISKEKPWISYCQPFADEWHQAWT